MLVETTRRRILLLHASTFFPVLHFCVLSRPCPLQLELSFVDGTS